MEVVGERERERGREREREGERERERERGGGGGGKIQEIILHELYHFKILVYK